MNHVLNGIDRAQVLVEALPYIKRFHGQTIVVKLGGHAIEQAKQETLLDIVLLRYVGMLPVLVHGGGAEITSMSERLGLKAEFKQGLRVTDAQTNATLIVDTDRQLCVSVRTSAGGGEIGSLYPVAHRRIPLHNHMI